MKKWFPLFLLLTSCASWKNDIVDRSVSTATPVITTDHHVHIMSPELIALWKGMGIPFSRPDHYYADIDSIVNALKVENIVLISMAYVYASGEFGGGATGVSEKIKAENDFLAKAKSKYPNRIKAYYGVDPLYPAAIDEVRRCHDELRLDGIKLHFNASQVYLTEPEHLDKVAQLFSYAADQQIPVLMHFDNSHPKFGKRDVQILADSILSKMKFVDLQIAHFGTSGGFNQKTKDVLDQFIAMYASDHPIKKHNITFDISAVGLDKDAEGVPKLTDEAFAELAAYCRRLGFERIVFGTDYPLYRSAEYLDVLRTRLKLSDAEVRMLLRGR